MSSLSEKRAIFVNSIQDHLDRMKQHIPFDKVHHYLPFATVKRVGTDHIHIVNDSVYPIETERNTISMGQTLCKRSPYAKTSLTSMMDDTDVNDYTACPGCLAVAQGLAVRDLR
jgi:hypothetical protein